LHAYFLDNFQQIKKSLVYDHKFPKDLTFRTVEQK